MRYFAIAASFAFAITAMLASGSANAETIKSDGKCWINNQQTYYHWGECPKEKHAKGHAKGHAKVAKEHGKDHAKVAKDHGKDHAKGEAKPKKG
jgi:hypothetical protein